MIKLEKEESGLWIVTLSRPEKANSLTKAMLLEIEEIAKAAHAAKALILTGEGRVFSAGADLDEARQGLAVDPIWERVSAQFADLPCFKIAALNGTLAGGAMGMVLACDVRLTVPGAKFFYPVMKLGFLPQPSDPKRLIALMGPARAKMLLMGGQKMTAHEAFAFGLVDRVVEAPELLDTARAIAADTLNADPVIARRIKSLCQPE